MRKELVRQQSTRGNVNMLFVLWLLGVVRRDLELVPRWHRGLPEELALDVALAILGPTPTLANSRQRLRTWMCDAIHDGPFHYVLHRPRRHKSPRPKLQDTIDEVTLAAMLDWRRAANVDWRAPARHAGADALAQTLAWTHASRLQPGLLNLTALEPRWLRKMRRHCVCNFTWATCVALASRHAKVTWGQHCWCFAPLYK